MKKLVFKYAAVILSSRNHVSFYLVAFENKLFIWSILLFAFFNSKTCHFDFTLIVCLANGFIYLGE